MNTPLALPHLRLQVTETGDLTMALDGDAYTPPGGPYPLRRESVRRIVDAARTDLGTIRVEIVEADGSTYTDILLADDPAQDAEPQAMEPYASGFLPGEPVAVAVIVGEHAATEDGKADVHLPAAILAGHAGAIVLIGRTSGTLTYLGTDR